MRRLRRIVQCSAAPDMFRCQHRNGIWRFADGGGLWKQIKDAVPASDFGFAVAVNPHDPDTTWLVPAVADRKRIPVDDAPSVN